MKVIASKGKKCGCEAPTNWELMQTNIKIAA